MQFSRCQMWPRYIGSIHWNTHAHWIKLSWSLTERRCIPISINNFAFIMSHLKTLDALTDQTPSWWIFFWSVKLSLGNPWWEPFYFWAYVTYRKIQNFFRVFVDGESCDFDNGLPIIHLIGIRLESQDTNSRIYWCGLSLLVRSPRTFPVVKSAREGWWTHTVESVKIL